VFVNLHPSDLEDDELYAGDGALTPFASRIVLEITDRATLEGVGWLRHRVERLRAVGFRIAIDDLGAGYAGLSSFAALEPDVVKADMSLVRGIDASPVKQKLVPEGLEALTARDIPKRARPPAVVIVSGHLSDDLRTRLAAVGADRFISKPFSPSDIESAVTEFVKTSTAAGAVNGTARSVGE
jgi:predicted signal transduction protein with EAL and GGDEF domain